MLDLSVKYMGLTLRNPIIVGSSGLTDSSEKIVELEKFGAGAVVLKSIFEEEITLEYEDFMREAEGRGISDENLDYFDYKIREENLSKYLNLIKETKEKVFIPVIASINCKSSHDWMYFAKKFQEAGTDGLELNMFILPSDKTVGCEEIQKIYFDVAKKVKEEVSIPVSMKISSYFSNISSVIYNLSCSGIDGLVLFNRFYNPDIDINQMKLVSGNIKSNPNDYVIPLRWLALTSQSAKCDLAASTGIFDGKAAIKQILAGASAVQVVSSIYENGTAHIQTILDDVERWMTEKGFDKIDQFIGKFSHSADTNPSNFERMQFMRYFSSYNG